MPEEIELTAQPEKRPAKAGKRASTEKWGEQVMNLGFCIIPSLLLQAQRRLGLNPTQLAVLLQLCDFWWEAGRKPFPSKAKLSERLGLSERQIQRHIAELEKAGLVRRVQRHGHNGSKLSNTYDLTGLVVRLGQLEPDFREVKEAAKAARNAVAKPGYRVAKPRTAAKGT